MNKKILALIAASIRCFADDCDCLGPENIISNPPLKPVTCNGDFSITVSAFYWSAHQDGMDYAINNQVGIPVINPTLSELQQLNQLNEATYQKGSSKWEFGYKFGVGYNSPCDGWNVELLWTHFQPFATTSVEASVDDNQALITLWSDFAAAQGSITFGRFIEANWRLNLDLVDICLGRNFWASRRLSMQPYVGFRLANVKQDYEIEELGGSWSPRVNPDQNPFNNFVHLDNNFQGVGLKSGMDCAWHVGCGWAIFGEVAGSIIYGSFDVKHDEENRLGITPNTKNTIVKTKNHFRSSRSIIDSSIGVEYSARFSTSDYGVTARLGWDQHLFFNQNQLWRVNRIGNGAGVVNNGSGENTFYQRRGTLDTSGITLSLLIEF